jgi:hypothetical protein
MSLPLPLLPLHHLMFRHISPPPPALSSQTDISTTLIQQLKAKHAHIPNLSYCVSDCRCMPEFKECSFGSVIDKGEAAVPTRSSSAALSMVQAAPHAVAMSGAMAHSAVPRVLHQSCRSTADPMH